MADTINAHLDALVLPKRLWKHFLRGLFDGDGSLHRIVKLNKWRCSQLGRPEVLEMLADFTQKHLGDPGLPPRWCRGIWVKPYNKQDQVPIIMNLLYDGATVFLDRKAAKVAEMNRQLSIDVNRKTAYTARQEVRNNV